MSANPFRRFPNSFFLIAIVFLAGISATPHATPYLKQRYRIAEGSKLYLKGKSNVNTFTCDCEDQFSDQTADLERNGGLIRFRNAEMSMKSKNFNCHNRKIDSDMQKALQADQYPHIKVALTQTWQDAKCLNGECKDWFDLQAKVNITITSVTKEEYISAKARALGNNRFQLRGEKVLQMSAYGIKPPEAMLGMIKVNDWITFHFDLTIQTDATVQ